MFLWGILKRIMSRSVWSLLQKIWHEAVIRVMLRVLQKKNISHQHKLKTWLTVVVSEKLSGSEDEPSGCQSGHRPAVPGSPSAHLPSWSVSGACDPGVASISGLVPSHWPELGFHKAGDPASDQQPKCYKNIHLTRACIQFFSIWMIR